MPSCLRQKSSLIERQHSGMVRQVSCEIKIRPDVFAELLSNVQVNVPQNCFSQTTKSYRENIFSNILSKRIFTSVYTLYIYV
jgi:hypothetical protein